MFMFLVFNRTDAYVTLNHFLIVCIERVYNTYNKRKTKNMIKIIKNIY